MRARIIATVQLVLLFPAVLFMSSLILRQLQPQQSEPAHSAQQVVLWYAARMWSLWILLLALPMAVLVAGGATLLRGWKRDTALTSAARQLLAVIRAQFAMLVVAAATLAACGILAIVVLHMLAN
jgi:ABC-type Fe3+ transport system permease subunit